MKNEEEFGWNMLQIEFILREEFNKWRIFYYLYFFGN